jgi:hypothetical protein
MTLVPVCFLKGTQIWTPGGESGVEDLRIGDFVVTSSGEAKPIQWVWRQRFERQSGQDMGRTNSPTSGGSLSSWAKHSASRSLPIAISLPVS